MVTENEDIVIELANRMVVLKVLPFDTDINVDEILKIQHEHLWAEIITFTVLFNRIANLRAEQENIVSHTKFDLEVFYAQLYEECKKKALKGDQKVTEKAVESSILRDARYIAKKKRYFEMVRNFNYLDSLYWSAQNKASLLKVLSDKMRPEEFSEELLTETINGIMIKTSKKII